MTISNKHFLVVIFFITNSIFSQYSKEFLKVVSNIKPYDSIKVIEKFKNGKLKKEYIKTFYIVGKSKYWRYSGKFSEYYKNGNTATNQTFDKFGFLLNYEFFNKKGILISEIKTKVIDTDNKNVLDFFNNKMKHNIISDYKEYYYDKKYNFLYREGQKHNNDKIGIWRTYNNCGDTIKIKEFRKR